MRHPAPWRWAIPLLLLAASPVRGFEPFGDPPPHFTLCPALSSDFPFEPEGLSATAPSRPEPTLIVMGTPTVLSPPGAADGLCKIAIEETLFGHAPGGTVRCAFRRPPAPGRQILALAPTIFRQDLAFDLSHTWPLSEERAQAALAQARLDYYALAATRIVLAHDREHLRNGAHRIAIESTLAGDPLPAGTTLTVQGDEFYEPFPASAAPVLRPPMLYFLQDATDRDGPVCTMLLRLPPELQPAVTAALARREDYPLVNFPWGAKTVPAREILLRASTDDALAFLDSPNMAAVGLAQRTLFHRKSSALAPLSEALRRELFRFDRSGPLAYAGLKHRIDLLKHMSEDGPGGTLDSLLTYALYAASTAPPPPPRTVPIPRALSQYEEHQLDRNHALAWMAAALSAEALDRLGPRIRAARDAAPPAWKAEFQLALDACSVEDTLALRGALARTAGLQPVELAPAGAAAQPFLNPADTAVAFSADGTRLRARTPDGVLSTWDPAAAKLLHRAKLPGAALGASPDGQFVACVTQTVPAHAPPFLRGAAPPRQLLTVLDADSGAAVSALTVPSAQAPFYVAWIDADTAVLATPDLLCRFNPRSGAILSSVPASLGKAPPRHTLAATAGALLLADGFSSRSHVTLTAFDLLTGHAGAPLTAELPFNPALDAGLVPDGRHLHLAGTDLYLVDRTTAALVFAKPFRQTLSNLTFTPDGVFYALIATPLSCSSPDPTSRGEEPPSSLRIYHTLTGTLVAAFALPPGPAPAVAVSPAAQHLAALRPTGVLRLYPLPPLTPPPASPGPPHPKP